MDGKFIAIQDDLYEYQVPIRPSLLLSLDTDTSDEPMSLEKEIYIRHGHGLFFERTERKVNDERDHLQSVA
jgi:hypothetical protein